MRPLPVLVVVGQKGGGKTVAVRAVLRMLHGPGADVAGLSHDRRDLLTQLSALAVVGLDNLDDHDLPSWLPDELASAATGRVRETRKLYSDDTLLSRPLTAALAITTRSAAFCRPDVAERALPLVTADFPDSRRVADADLMASVDAHRDRLLSWGALTAQEMLERHVRAPAGLPLRFVDFGRLVWAYVPETGSQIEAPAVLTALRQAQALAVGEGDPLVEAIVGSLGQIATGGGDGAGPPPN